MCKMLSDSNAKIQMQALDSFAKELPFIIHFVDHYLQTFFVALMQNLASSNTGVRRQTEQIMAKIQESI